MIQALYFPGNVQEELEQVKVGAGLVDVPSFVGWLLLKMCWFAARKIYFL